MITILIVMVLIVISALFLTKQFNLPRNISLLFMAQPLVMCSAPIIVFIGGLLSSELSPNKSLATLPITLMILGVAAGSIPAAMIAKFWTAACSILRDTHDPTTTIATSITTPPASTNWRGSVRRLHCRVAVDTLIKRKLSLGPKTGMDFRLMECVEEA